MKKLGLAVAVASALGVTSSVVNAYNVGEYAVGQIVAYASFDSSTVGTFVGLISCAKGDVNWVFKDQDSKHISDGKFSMTKNDMYAFSLAAEAGLGLEGKQGYLVFTFDEAEGTNQPDTALTTSDAGCLAANAFYVDIPNNDVAFVPVAPVNYSDYNHGQGIAAGQIRFLSNDSITSLTAGAQLNETIANRYFIDNQTGGNDTDIMIWTVCKPLPTQTAIMYDDNQDDKSVNFALPHDELNIVDPETILGREPDHLDGFISWTVNAAPATATAKGAAYCDHDASGTIDATAEDTQAALSLSIISSTAIGADQTVYNPHDHNASNSANTVN